MNSCLCLYPVRYAIYSKLLEAVQWHRMLSAGGCDCKIFTGLTSYAKILSHYSLSAQYLHVSITVVINPILFNLHIATIIRGRSRLLKGGVPLWSIVINLVIFQSKHSLLSNVLLCYLLLKFNQQKFSMVIVYA